MNPFKPYDGLLRIREVIRQGAHLIAFSVLIAVGVNAIRQAGLPWFAAGPPPSAASPYLHDLQEIPLEEAWSLYQQGTAIFLDARDPLSFQQGHIEGALNVPLSEAEAYLNEVLTLAKSGHQVIAYCDGVDCPLSPELARILQRFGVPSVKVLVDGWRRWLEAGCPIEEG